MTRLASFGPSFVIATPVVRDALVMATCATGMVLGVIVTNVGRGGGCFMAVVAVNGGGGRLVVVAIV